MISSLYDTNRVLLQITKMQGDVDKMGQQAKEQSSINDLNTLQQVNMSKLNSHVRLDYFGYESRTLRSNKTNCSLDVASKYIIIR